VKCLNTKGVTVKIGSRTTVSVSAKINVVMGNRVNFTVGFLGTGHKCPGVTTKVNALCVLQQAANY